MKRRTVKKPTRRRNPDERAAYLSDVRRVYDTRGMEDGYEIGGIGVVYDGALQTFHVTDHPEKLIQSLKRHANVVSAYGPKGAHAELGPGLYLSGVPHFWMSRAHGKWSFLDDLTPMQIRRLTGALAEAVDDQRDVGRISRSETTHADRILDAVRAGTAPVGVTGTRQPALRHRLLAPVVSGAAWHRARATAVRRRGQSGRSPRGTQPIHAAREVAPHDAPFGPARGLHAHGHGRQRRTRTVGLARRAEPPDSPAPMIDEGHPL